MFHTFHTCLLRYGTLKAAWIGLFPYLPYLPYLNPARIRRRTHAHTRARVYARKNKYGTYGRYGRSTPAKGFNIPHLGFEVWKVWKLETE
ncbi:hypothetical protein [Nitrosomonas marina]|uniref:hypothetical protein n=1 Tax=Nitrosomonas marina TaxID=917 RepID=UPI0015A6B475|nr:hypothetical protein [Nitrosomonas marina]